VTFPNFNVMFLRDRTTQLLVVTYVAMIVAAVVANSQELIYSKVGCWPTYGDSVIHYGAVSVRS